MRHHWPVSGYLRLPESRGAMERCPLYRTTLLVGLLGRQTLNGLDLSPCCEQLCHCCRRLIGGEMM